MALHSAAGDRAVLRVLPAGGDDRVAAADDGQPQERRARHPEAAPDQTQVQFQIPGQESEGLESLIPKGLDSDQHIPVL